jgi:nitrate reductase cytochrome c-type subunit
MLYGFDCECGEEVDARRIALGYNLCLACGEVEAKKRRFCVAPINKSNYMMITDRELLKQLNPKRTT